MQANKVLLVEDNPGDIRLAQEVFNDSKMHNELYIARNGIEALDFVHKRGSYLTAPTPDMILLDLNLPKIDGREVLADIKSDPILKRIPVVILTSSQAEKDIKSAYDLNANAYVIKPLDLDNFIDIIKAIEVFWLSIVKLSETAL